METITVDGIEFQVQFGQRYAEFTGGQFLGTAALHLEGEGSFTTSSVYPIDMSPDFMITVGKLHKEIVDRLTAK